VTKGNFKSGCVICGLELEYLKNNEEMQCFFCGQVSRSNVRCVNNHYVCDRCHSLSANDFIEHICIKTELKDPLQLALSIMVNENIKMHGPEHHFLVPAVLLACYYNVVHSNYSEIKEKKIRAARERAEKILGGFCGTHGNCGAAVGTGVFMSLITDATPLSGKEWKWSNMVTAQTLRVIALHGGPRCCKRASFLAIIEAVKYLRKQFNILLPVDESLQCEYHTLNMECRENRCLFFSG
jgi:predicted RNA-binding Zn-ribbon protein involved in translation (DUF1610 family)